MVNWQDFVAESVQGVLFTPDHSAFFSGRVVATILRKFGERFSGEMQVLPIPPDIPPEIPRIALQSDDGSHALNAAPAQFSYTWKRPNDNTLTLHQAVDQCVDVLGYYVSEMRVRVGRIGLVVNRACPNPQPAQTLIRQFCNEASQREPFNRSATFEIHNHKEYIPLAQGVDYTINSWVRCRCGAIEPEKTPAIVVVQDLNTIAADLDRRLFDTDGIRAFFSMASEEAETIIKEYFPDQERL
jgi:hypothetical protein